MSEYIIDTGKTRTEPIDYSWRSKRGGGCLGTIDCKECGCIMAAQGSNCFCMGVYTCPRCGYKSDGWVGDIRGYQKNLIFEDELQIDPDIFRKVVDGFQSGYTDYEI